MTDDRELSRQLTTLIRATPGVVEVYSTKPLIGAAVTGVVSVFTDRGDALVKIGHDGPVTTVLSHVAVAEELPGPDTLRSVTEAIRGYLTGLGVRPAIEVKVVRFSE
ncbi:MAG: hypothetical protein JWP75_2404 [Frondihabitans sp.]|nr:hypothetical protein [Frondihabitans sp.]